jgi:hypothetical protein
MNMAPKIFRPKGEMELDPMLTVSIIGPIGQPYKEAMYPNVPAADGQPMNALNGLYHQHVKR